MASIGRGTLYNLVARVSFLASGYALQISMARWLASPAEYGRFGILLSIVTLARVILSAGLPQAVAQFVAAQPNESLGIYRRGEALQMGAATAVWIAFVALAPLLGAWLGDPALRSLLWQISPLIPLMASYQVSLGYVSGQLRFDLQALLTFVYSVARYALPAALVLAGLGLDGAVLGLVASTAVVAVWSWLSVPRGRPPSPVTTRQFLHLAWPLVIFSFGVSALLNLDLVLLGRFFPNSPDLGFYSGAVNVGKAPYFAFYAFSSTMLPVLARHHARGESEQLRRLLRHHVRLLLLGALPSAGILAAVASESLQLIYGGRYGAATLPLMLLSGSSCGLSLMVVLASALTACGRPKLSMSLILASLPAQWLLGLLLIPRYGMTGAAISNFLSTLVGLFVAWRAVQRNIGGAIDLRFLGSAAFSTLLAAAVLIFLPFATGVWLFAKILLGFVLCGVALLLTGGISRGEVMGVRQRLLHSD